MARLHVLILLSLLFFALAVIAGLIVAGLRALALWQTLRRSRRRLDRELAELTRRLGRTEQRLAGANEQAVQLDRARLALQDSVATALVLARAAGEASALAGRMRAVFPSK